MLKLFEEGPTIDSAALIALPIRAHQCHCALGSRRRLATIHDCSDIEFLHLSEVGYLPMGEQIDLRYGEKDAASRGVIALTADQNDPDTSWQIQIEIHRPTPRTGVLHGEPSGRFRGSAGKGLVCRSQPAAAHQ